MKEPKFQADIHFLALSVTALVFLERLASVKGKSHLSSLGRSLLPLFHPKVHIVIEGGKMVSTQPSVKVS